MASQDQAFILREHMGREHPGTNQGGLNTFYSVAELTKRHVWLHEYARKRGLEPEVVEHRVDQPRGLFGPKGPALLRHG